MTHFHLDPPLEIGGHKLSVVSQIQISGNNYGAGIFICGYKRPVAVLSCANGEDQCLVFDEDQIDQNALRKFLIGKSTISTTFKSAS